MEYGADYGVGADEALPFPGKLQRVDDLSVLLPEVPQIY